MSVPYPSLSDAFNNPGISDDSTTTAGNLDGGGFSYSAQALAANGLTPGAAITHDGVAFTWPGAQPGTPDNVVAGGQTIALSGSGTTLGLLGAGDYGAASGSGTITYTDGSTQQFTVGFPDWWSNTAPASGDILATDPYINTPSGRQNQQDSIYYVGIPLQAGKTVKYLTLPDLSEQAVQGSTAMHIFAAGFACCSLSVKAPDTVTPGQTATVHTGLANGSAQPVTSASVSLTAPSGWTASANGAASASSLGGGQSLDTDWSLAVPSSAACGRYLLHASAALTDPSGASLTLPQTAAVGITCGSVAEARNNVGTTSDSATSAGNMDGQTDSYSAEGLASAGLSPGASVTVGGVSLTWPNVSAGQPDNIVAEGQTIDLSGSGSHLVFLGSSDFGTGSGTGTVTYTDGTSQLFTLTLADWYNNAPQAGGTLVASTHWNTSTGPGTHIVGMYSASVPLDSSKTVQSVTLPAVSTGVTRGSVAMHIFALGAG
jgi:hypothetical protein